MEVVAPAHSTWQRDINAATAKRFWKHTAATNFASAHNSTYRSDFCWEKCWQSGLSEDTEKRGLPQFTTMKKFSKFWFQQDGAEAHTADLTLDLVEIHFKKRLISKRFLLKKRVAGSGCCTAQSQFFGLLPLGYVKDWCYANRPTTISALWENITSIFDLLREDPGIFSLVTRNFQKSLERVVEREGGHIENVII